MTSSSPTRWARLGAALGAFVFAALVQLAGAGTADGARYQLRSYSLGRATHTPSADGTLASRRMFTQGFDLRAYDLTGERTGALNAVLDARYTTDFHVPEGRHDDPVFAHRWNDVALRLAYLEYRPDSAFRARLGRQWSRGTLGIRDFDGLRLTLRPRLAPAVDGLAEIYGGRDVEIALAPYATDEFDVQGLPARNTDELAERFDAARWLAGGRLGMNFGAEAAIEFAYRRRWQGGFGGSELRVGSERLGSAAAMSPHRRLTVAADATYHTLLQGLDRAEIDLAWRVPGPLDTLSFGVEHRHPWFDASSIFNLFGTRPHQGGYAVIQQGIEPLATQFELRSWGRLYRGTPAAPGVGTGTEGGSDVTRLGGALAHDSDLHPFDHPVDWSSQMSIEADTALEESTHLLAGTRLRSPLFFDDFYLSGRFLVLGVAGHDPTVSSTVASTFVLGAEIPIRNLGTLDLIAEHTLGRGIRSTTDLYGTLNLEIWPG